MPDYGLVQSTGEHGIGGGLTSIPDGPRSMVTIYVMADDLEATLAKAESLGGKTMVPPTAIPNVGAFAWFSDPDGNCIGLFKSTHGG